MRRMVGNCSVDASFPWALRRPYPFPGTLYAQQEQSQAWAQAVRSILGDAKPTEAKLNFDMPEIAENGDTVPFSVRVDSPMTEKDYVKAIHVISTGNPQPGVANFPLHAAVGQGDGRPVACAWRELRM